MYTLLVTPWLVDYEVNTVLPRRAFSGRHYSRITYAVVLYYNATKHGKIAVAYSFQTKD